MVLLSFGLLLYVCDGFDLFRLLYGVLLVCLWCCVSLDCDCGVFLCVRVRLCCCVLLCGGVLCCVVYLIWCGLVLCWYVLICV